VWKIRKRVYILYIHFNTARTIIIPRRTHNKCVFYFFRAKIYYNILYEYIIERESLLFHLYLYVYKWNK